MILHFLAFRFSSLSSIACASFLPVSHSTWLSDHHLNVALRVFAQHGPSGHQQPPDGGVRSHNNNNNALWWTCTACWPLHQGPEGPMCPREAHQPWPLAMPGFSWSPRTTTTAPRHKRQRWGSADGGAYH